MRKTESDYVSKVNPVSIHSFPFRKSPWTAWHRPERWLPDRGMNNLSKSSLEFNNYWYSPKWRICAFESERCQSDWFHTVWY